MILPTYAVYISKPEEEREKLYQQYCKKNKLDSTLEYSIYEFFDAMDKKNETTDTDTSDL